MQKYTVMYSDFKKTMQLDELWLPNKVYSTGKSFKVTESYSTSYEEILNIWLMTQRN